MDTMERTDPIDQLVPRPRTLPVRLLIGVTVLVVVGIVSVLVGFGYVYPQPECCGSGGGSPMLTLADDGESVVLVTSFYNSSGRQLVVERADVSLPGAEVLEVTFAPSVMNGGQYWPVDSTPAPTRVAGHTDGRLIVRFVPDECRWDSTDINWGSAALHLEVDNGWLPSIGRTWRIPGGLVSPGPNDLGILPPAGYQHGSSTGDPLEEACALLAAAPA